MTFLKNNMFIICQSGVENDQKQVSKSSLLQTATVKITEYAPNS